MLPNPRSVVYRNVKQNLVRFRITYLSVKLIEMKYSLASLGELHGHYDSHCITNCDVRTYIMAVIKHERTQEDSVLTLTIVLLYERKLVLLVARIMHTSSY